MTQPLTTHTKAENTTTEQATQLLNMQHKDGEYTTTGHAAQQMSNQHNTRWHKTKKNTQHNRTGETTKYTQKKVKEQRTKQMNEQHKNRWHKTEKDHTTQQQNRRHNNQTHNTPKHTTQKEIINNYRVCNTTNEQSTQHQLTLDDVSFYRKLVWLPKNVTPF